MLTHKALKKQALDAIHALHSDTNVPRSQTKEDLVELRDEIDIMIDALGERP
jgi:hypothetical protein